MSNDVSPRQQALIEKLGFDPNCMHINECHRCNEIVIGAHDASYKLCEKRQKAKVAELRKKIKQKKKDGHYYLTWKELDDLIKEVFEDG